MKVQELRELTVAELAQKELELSEELRNLRFQHALSQLDNPMKMVEVKRTIARVKTVIREAQLKESL